MASRGRVFKRRSTKKIERPRDYDPRDKFGDKVEQKKIAYATGCSSVVQYGKVTMLRTPWE